MKINKSRTNFTAGNGAATLLASGVISVNTTAVGTDADTDEKDLMSYTLPANSLSADGKAVRITAWFTTAVNANTKTIKLYFGAQVLSSNSGNFNSGDSYETTAIVIRTGVGTQEAMHKYIQGANNFVIGQIEPGEDETGAITIKTTGQNGTAAANDVVCQAMMIEFLN